MRQSALHDDDFRRFSGLQGGLTGNEEGRRAPALGDGKITELDAAAAAFGDLSQQRNCARENSARKMLVLINLDSAVERRRSMASQLAGFGIEFQRVGVDLRRCSAQAVQDRVAELFPGLQIRSGALSPAEVGCWLSHLSAWRLLCESGAPSCTVIEDDLQLAPQFAEALAALEGQARYDLIFLGTSSRNISQRRFECIHGLQVHRPVGMICNTWGYVITRDYAERFFGVRQRALKWPIDHFLGGRGASGSPRIAVLQPAVVTEDPVLGLHSQIGPYTRRLDRSPFIEQLRRRLLSSAVSDLYYTLYRYL